MTDLLTEVGKTCVDKLIDGAIEESRYVCCFTSIEEEFKEARDNLQYERNTMEERINVEVRRGNDIAPNARHWEEQADKLIQEDMETKKKCFFGFFPDCVWRYKRGKELANKIEKMKKLVEDRNTSESIGIPGGLPDIEFYSSQDYIPFKGRESKYTELLEALKDENNFITGLYGMGGAGKTTLAREVGKELKQIENFKSVIVTAVSNTPNIMKIQDDIAAPLDLKLKDCTESERPKTLWRRLTNGEKILVILDDVWDQNPIDFEAIGIPQRDNHKGCRVLVTTRTTRQLTNLGCDKIIELEVLSDEDAWTMFERYADISNSSPKILIPKGRKIVDECKGLPKAIEVVARILKGHHYPAEWDVVLKALQNPLSSRQGVDDEGLAKIYNCFEVSYDRLKNKKAKGLFLLCSVFPEDEKIDVETLTRLGIGAGLFEEHYDSYNDARDQIVAAKRQLQYSCLLEGDEGLVKMHDLVRDAAQLIANREIRTINMSHKDPKSLVDRVKNTKYLFLEGKVREMFSSSFGGSKLEILIAAFDTDGDGDCVEVPNSFFENMAGLRVLHLDHKRSSYAQCAFSLPSSIQSSMNIRSLLVSRVNLGNISVLGNLQCLETLDLDTCKIIELPPEITKLEKCKLLKLEDCEIKRNNPFEVIEKCSFLQELYFKNSFNNFCKEINYFPGLQRYDVSTESRYVEWDVLASKRVNLSNLDIFSEATLKYFFQTTDALQLHNNKKWQWRNLMPEIVPVDQGMNNLVELSLNYFSELQYLIQVVGSRVPNVFSKLVVLTLCVMENLEELCNGPLSLDSLKDLEKLLIYDCNNFRSLSKFNLNLSNLKSITLRKCPLLVSLFPLSTAQSLMMLEKLEINHCEQLENIITDEKRGAFTRAKLVDGDNDNKKHSSMFPKIKALEIINCPRLEFILPFVYGELPVVLEAISIGNCDKLKYIFDQFVKLGSLKELTVYGSPNFIDIFPERGHLVPLITKRPSSSLRHGFKEPTQLEPIKCNVFSWTHKWCYCLNHKHKLRSTTSTKIPLVSEDQPPRCLIASIIMCNITKIELSDVPKIKSVFILSITPTMLLETLLIENCDELRHIIVDIEDETGGNNSSTVFPRLKELNVDNCEQLEYIFGHYTHHDYQSHNEIHLHLPELKSLQLWDLPSLVAMCPKQYCTTFPSLVELELDNCSKLVIKSIGDFILHSISRSLDSTTLKELSGNVEHFLALKKLHVKNSKVENVFFLNEINGPRLNFMLQMIKLQDMHVMTYLFVGPKSSVTLQNLTWIEIERCEKLEIIFSTSVVRCLPQLLKLRIEECKELKHIIEDDAEDEMIPGTCFPKLGTLAVVNCNKLEFVFPVSICKELHKLKLLMIREADALQEVFRSKDGQKVEIPNLKVIVFVNLPSLCEAQTIQFQNVEHRLVENCQKLSLTSVSTLSDGEIADLDWGLPYYIGNRSEQLPEEAEARDIRNENPSAETSEDFATGIEVRATSGHELSSSQELLNKESTGQHELGETDTTNKPSQRNNCLKEIKDQSIQEASASEKDITTIMSTNSETMSKPPTQFVSPKSKQESFKTSAEEGTTLVNAKIVTSSGPLVTSEHKTSSHDGNLSAETSKDFSVQAALGHKLTSSQELLNERSESQQCLMSQQHPLGETDDTTAKPSQGNNCLEETKDQSIQEVLISEKAITSVGEGTTLDDNVKTVKTPTHLESINSSSRPLVTFEHKTSLQVKDDEIRVSEPKPSSLASQSISTTYEGKPSQIVENLSSSSLITLELQQLVSKKHLASENFSLLIDFLVKHPSVHLKDNSLSNKYKGYAYNCLAELLKFLQTHSILDVVGSKSNRSKFVELLQDARSFDFDKDWLDGVEKRVLFPDLHFSQDAWEKLLHSKQQVTKEIEMLHLKIGIFTQHVEELKHQLTSSEAVLESINQQEAQVLESRDALSAPLGY